MEDGEGKEGDRWTELKLTSIVERLEESEERGNRLNNGLIAEEEARQKAVAEMRLEAEVTFQKAVKARL